MTTTPRHRNIRVTASLAAVLMLAATAACGDDGATSVGSSASTDAPPSADIEITAVHYRFEGIPAGAPAGATLALRNQSTGELHELVAMRLADNESRAAAELIALPQQDLLALFAGPPAAVLVAPPGEDSFAAVGDGTLNEPGRYMLMCFIPTGADPTAYLDALEAKPGQPPSVPGGAPHFTAGMYGEITVR